MNNLEQERVVWNENLEVFLADLNDGVVLFSVDPIVLRELDGVAGKDEVIDASIDMLRDYTSILGTIGVTLTKEQYASLFLLVVEKQSSDIAIKEKEEKEPEVPLSSGGVVAMAAILERSDTAYTSLEWEQVQEAQLILPLMLLHLEKINIILREGEIRNLVRELIPESYVEPGWYEVIE